MKKFLRNAVSIIVILGIILIIVSEFDSIFNNDKYKTRSTMSKDIEEIRETGLVVHYLDVGQGDAIFVELPNKETLLIDSGNKSNGKGIVEYIKSLGHRSLTYVIATHPHSDHIGGMEDIIRNLQIHNFYMPNKSHTTKTFEKMLIALKEKGVSIKTAKAGVEVVESDDLKGVLIGPVKDNYSNLNDYSAILKLDYFDRSFLFTGDSEKEGEASIEMDYKTDVLKVGHHGSDTSTTDEFLRKASPKYGIISSGINNRYNHPSDITIKKLNDSGVKVYRTDLDGTIIFATDGQKILIQTIETDI